MNAAMGRPAQYISFLLAGEAYAVSIRRTREVVAFDVLTRIPMAPPGVRGVFNLRGRIVPVIDLARKLGLPATEPTRWTCILMTEVECAGEPSLMGMMIDTVSDVIDLSPADVEPPPPFGARVRLDYLAGMARVGEKIVLLLDIDRILSLEELFDPTPILPESTRQPELAQLPPALVRREVPPVIDQSDPAPAHGRVPRV